MNTVISSRFTLYLIIITKTILKNRFNPAYNRNNDRRFSKNWQENNITKKNFNQKIWGKFYYWGQLQLQLFYYYKKTIFSLHSVFILGEKLFFLQKKMEIHNYTI